MNKAYFRKEADKLKEECRQRKLARERARQEAIYLMSEDRALSISLGMVRRRVIIAVDRDEALPT